MLSVLRFLRDLVRAFVPNRDARALLVEISGIVAVSLLLGIALYRHIPASPAWARAQALARRGELAAAEAVYWEHLRKNPGDVPLLLELMDNHAMLNVLVALGEAPLAGSGGTIPRGVIVTDDRIERLLRDRRLPRGVALLGRVYWEARHGGAPDASMAQVEAAAVARPPMRWANHVLGRIALLDDDPAKAAEHFAREGTTFARGEDLEQAIGLWVAAEQWDDVRERLHDRRWNDAIDPYVRHLIALEDGQWLASARWLLVDTLRPELAPLLVALVAGLMWFLFVARLGKLGERPVFRGATLAVAFALGVASIAPTLFLITVEDHFLHLEETGDLVRDAIYFTAGVGLREEASKLLMFAPLLLVLRRWGSRLDVLACGAMVGLGFATEENLNYFAADAGASAVGRFLTANFLHMSMTALCAEALDHFVERPAERSMDFTVTFLTVVCVHGAYDFFAANPAVGELSFLSVTVFILLTRKFLGVVRQTRGRPDAHDKFLRRLVQAIAVVAGAGFVYACSEVGPGAAAMLLAVGLLGDAIIIYVFVHETRTV